MKWDPKLYNDSQHFVAEYGKGLLEFVPAHADKILDMGCGTGTLTNQLAERCHYVLGIDSSDSMILEALKSYPYLDFATGDALKIAYDREWDIVFSNAVFHWINDHNLLLAKIHKALKPGGKLICEFGAHGNIATIENGFAASLRETTGTEYISRFNFPTENHFGHILSENGFAIEETCCYDRPTPLRDGEQGLYNWATQFFQEELAKLTDFQKKEILAALNEKTKNDLWNGTCWIADYKRLRVIAAKPDK